MQQQQQQQQQQQVVLKRVRGTRGSKMIEQDCKYMKHCNLSSNPNALGIGKHQWGTVYPAGLAGAAGQLLLCSGALIHLLQSRGQMMKYSFAQC
jgi:hypothetical protein